jgi:hypothetical protein
VAPGSGESGSTAEDRMTLRFALLTSSRHVLNLALCVPIQLRAQSRKEVAPPFKEGRIFFKFLYDFLDLEIRFFMLPCR